MQIPIYQIDAFADAVFSGNPAAVCPLDSWISDERMQAIAEENNLAETAFFVPGKPGDGHDFHIRWFTPSVEVPLCGHATLASADVIFRHLGFTGDSIRFQAQAGLLVASRTGGLIALDFPAWPSQPVAVPGALTEALGAAPQSAQKGNYLMAVYASEAEIAALSPDTAALASIDIPGIVATAPGDGETDFVSRFFAPRLGVTEDPVTGSAHCQLVPYWAGRLGQNRLAARQISRRGGVLSCTLEGDRVSIAGRAVEYLSGTINI